MLSGLNRFWSSNKSNYTPPKFDFTKTVFEPENPQHVIALRGKISQFNKSFNDVIKSDIIIWGTFSAELLLFFASQLVGFWLFLGAAALTYGVMMSMNIFNERHERLLTFTQQMEELINSYRLFMLNKGEIGSENATMLELVHALSTVVRTERFVKWYADQTYPNNLFSETFCTIMAAAPHHMPRTILKGDEPVVNTEFAGFAKGVSNRIKNNRISSFANDMLTHLFFSLYSQPTKVEVQQQQIDKTLIQFAKSYLPAFK